MQQVISELNPTLQLTENAKAILKGKEPLELAMPRISAISKIAHNPQRQSVANYDKDLFARLRFLRKQIADKENIPPYIVFNDATLQEWHNICQQAILKCCKLMVWALSN